jgi:glycosyltransferase involved in cell wall biosynthesis
VTRIAFCNKYYFLNGGTEKYLNDLMQYLPNLGHEVLPFSVNYAGSWPSRHQSFFLSPPAGPSQAHLRDIKLTPKNAIRFIDRSIYSVEARARLGRLLEAFGGVDIAYLLNIYNYMSPSIIHTFKSRNIPVVMQLGDYNLLCPSYSLLRDGRPCTLCVTGNYHHGLRYRCVKKNLAASLLRTTAMYIHKWLKIYDAVDGFVVPCRFMRDKLIEGGFPAKRIHLVPYPVEFPQTITGSNGKKDYMIYFGRISYEKGLDTLLKAYQKKDLPADLVLVGRSYDGEKERLMPMIKPDFVNRIRFAGFQTGKKLSRLIGEALFSVVPSRWYDNAPISIYESFGQATPVVAADIGGIPEQVVDQVNGRLFAPDDKDELAEALSWMLKDRKRLAGMGQKGRNYVTSELTIAKHSEQLLALFENLIFKKAKRQT